MKSFAGRSLGVRGFTLVEMLIAIVIFLLVVPLAVQGVRTGLAAWERLGKDAEETDWLRSARHVLRRQIAEALPLVKDVQGRRVVWFRGKRHALSFVGRLPRGMQVGGPYRQSLQLVSRGDGQALVIRFGPFYPTRDEGINSGGEDIVLIRGVTELDLAYFGRPDAGERASWHSEWVDKPVLPSLVRLSITRSGEHGDQIRMLVPVRVQAKLGL